MADIDDRLLLERLPAGRHEKRAAWLSELVDDARDVLRGGVADGAQLAERNRAADDAAVPVGIAQCLKQALRDWTQIVRARRASRTRRGEDLVDLVGMLGQGALYTAPLLAEIVVERERRPDGLARPNPHPHQRVLHDRQLVLLAAAIAHEAMDQLRLHAPAIKAR